MASRFIDTGLWNEDWFCELGSEYQNFWNYLTCACDNAGVWKPNKIAFEIISRTKINLVAFLQKVNEQGGKERIIVLENGRWFLTGFIVFQWFNKKNSFDLVLSNKLHKHIHQLLIINKIDFSKVRGLKEVLLDLQGQGHGQGKGKGIKEEERGMGKEETIQLSAKGFFIDSIPKNAPLSEMEICTTIEYLAIICKKTITQAEVLNLWEAYKIQWFDKKEWKNSRADMISHFRDFVKYKIQNDAGSKNGKGGIPQRIVIDESPTSSGVL